MTSVMIDSSAWIDLFEGKDNGILVQEFLEKKDCCTPSVVVAEVCSKIHKKGFDVDMAFRALTSMPIIPLTAEIAKSAGILHSTHHSRNPKFALADAIVLATAREMNAKILTKDTDFRNVPEAILLK